MSATIFYQPTNKPRQLKYVRTGIAVSHFNGETVHSVLIHESELAKRIGALINLEEDWDLDGALPIAPEIVQRATSFVTSAIYLNKGLPDWQVDVAPSTAGGIVLTWRSGNHRLALHFRKGIQEILAVEKYDGSPSITNIFQWSEALKMVRNLSRTGSKSDDL